MCVSSAPADLRKRVAGLVPPAGHHIDGNRTDQYLLAGQLVIEADFALSSNKH
jgi:hypothetical protein